MADVISVNLKNIRDKRDIQKMVTVNYLAIADLVVKKSGPVKNFGQFCKLTGLNKTSLSYIRGGTRLVPLESAVRACDVFGCSYDWMFANRGEMFGKEAAMRTALDLRERIDKIEKKLGIR